jgi:coenzyme PQQ precursor peptide PqqA
MTMMMRLRPKDHWQSDRIGHTVVSAAGEDPRAEIARSWMMRWSKPKILEVKVGLEINSYACADLG